MPAPSPSTGRQIETGADRASAEPPAGPGRAHAPCAGPSPPTAASSKASSPTRGRTCCARLARASPNARDTLLQTITPGHRGDQRHLQRPTRPRATRRTHPGRAWVRVLQRVMALTTAGRHNDRIGAPVARCLAEFSSAITTCSRRSAVRVGSASGMSSGAARSSVAAVPRRRASDGPGALCIGRRSDGEGSGTGVVTGPACRRRASSGATFSPGRVIAPAAGHRRCADGCSIDRPPDACEGTTH